MRSRFRGLALSICVLVASLGTATAQSDVAAPLGTLALSASPVGYEPMLSVAPFVPFQFYAVVQIDYADRGAPEQNDVNGLYGYEFSFTLDPRISLLEAVLVPATSLNIGFTPTEFIVGTGTLVPTPVDFVALVRFTALTTTAVEDVYVMPREASIQTIPGTPAWIEGVVVAENGCTNRVSGQPTKCLYPFADLDPLLINCANEPACNVLPTESTTWGGIKGRF